MQLNAQKCFTFGDRCVEDSLPQITTHKSQFRLVGASVKLDSKKGWTDLEKNDAHVGNKQCGMLVYYPPDGLPKWKSFNQQCPN